MTGVELVKKKENEEVYGMTSPLVLDSSGKKFGKSEGNALWLDSSMTTPFKIYQYFMNVSDEDVARFLKLLTLLDLAEIDTIVRDHENDPARRYGQSQLAKYVTETIHGKEAMERAIAVTAFLFGNEDKAAALRTMSKEDIAAISEETGGVFPVTENMTIVDALVESGLETSKGNAKKSIESGAIFLNEKKVADISTLLISANAINTYFLIRKGKKNFKVGTL